MIVGVVLAAGAGTRFGGRKQLALLDGRPLLEHALLAMAAAPVDRVVVVLGADADAIAAAVDLHGAEVVIAQDWAEGQSASLRAGVAAAAGAHAVVVALGDQPYISARAIARVIEARGAWQAARATYRGVPGHPVLIGHDLLARVAELRGDVGARDLLSGVHVVDVPCDGLGSPDDIDTPADLP